MGVNVREKPKGSGQWWVFINHLGRRKAKKIGNDEKLAHAVAEKIKAKLVLGDLKIEKVSNTCPTFKKYSRMWLSLPHEWKKSTFKNYTDNLEKHVYPVFGSSRLNEIKRKNLKLFFDQLLSQGLKRSTVSLVKAPISGVLSHAVDSELIEVNPLADLKISRRSKTFNVKPLTESEAQLLLDQAGRFMDGYYYPHFLCALRTGMRLGEMKALKYKDLDFKCRRIHVRRSCRRGIVSGTKTLRQRFVDMTPQLASTLQDQKVKQELNAMVAGSPMPEWTFANKKGNIFGRVAFENALHRCLTATGLHRIRIHDLRHTYATIRLLRGHNVGDVSYQLGHSSIQMTYDIYGHWIPGHFKSEVDELDHMQPVATHVQPDSTGS